MQTRNSEPAPVPQMQVSIGVTELGITRYGNDEGGRTLSTSLLEQGPMELTTWPSVRISVALEASLMEPQALSQTPPGLVDLQSLGAAGSNRNRDCCV